MNKMLNNDIKKLKNNKIIINRIKTSFEKKLKG
jgi:hypothetical protein